MGGRRRLKQRRRRPRQSTIQCNELRAQMLSQPQIAGVIPGQPVPLRDRQNSEIIDVEDFLHFGAKMEAKFALRKDEVPYSGLVARSE